MKTPELPPLSHLDAADQPTMVNVSEKVPTERKAIAQSIVQFPDKVFEQLSQKDWQSKKGSIFHTATLAGIMAAKKTADLIPLCHPLQLDHCSVDLKAIEHNQVQILCTVVTTNKTGVEMEALTGASVAALTLYDMCKALSPDILIKNTQLMEKKGGKRDFSR